MGKRDAAAGASADARRKPGVQQRKQEFPKARASHTSRYDKVASANDGIVHFGATPNNRWTSYESSDKTDWLEIDFGQPTRFSRIELALYDDRGGVQPPQSFEIEVWTARAGKQSPIRSAHPRNRSEVSSTSRGLRVLNRPR